MATQGTVTLYYRTTENHRSPHEGIAGFWHAAYAYLDGEDIIVRLQPSVGFQASDAQLRYHADRALRANCARHGDTYTPTNYSIER